MIFVNLLIDRSKKTLGRISGAFKYVFPKYSGLLNTYFLRKNSTFIKSKYSKNRQWSKSIVYFGLWFGVICAFVFTYYNYRFLMTLSYLWWVCGAMALPAFGGYLKKHSKHVGWGFVYVWF